MAALSSEPERVDLGQLVAAVGGLIDPGTAGEESIRVHLISDLQVSGLPTRFADLVPEPSNGRPIALRLHPVAEDSPDNWAIEFARATADGFEIGVRSFAVAAASKSVAVRVNDTLIDSQTQAVPAGGRALFRFSAVNLIAGTNRLVAQLTPADDLPADDVRFAVVDHSPPAAVPILTRDGNALPATYLRTALGSLPRGYRAEVMPVAEFDARVLARYPWLLVDDLGIIGPALDAALAEYLQAGGSVLAGLGNAALTRRELPVTGHVLAEISGPVTQWRSVARVETGHPALAATRGWRAVNVARTVALQPSAEDRVLIELSDGQPLLLERRQGAGRLVLLTTQLDGAWSDLAVQPVFVNFMAEVAGYLSGEQRLETQQIAGNSLILRQSGGVSGQVIDPAGREILDLADTRRAADIRLNQTGFYQVYTLGNDSLVAVNPDLRESDLASMSLGARTDWENLLASPDAAELLEPSSAVEAAPLALWKGLLILLAAVLLAESLLGNGYLGQKRGAA